MQSPLLMDFCDFGQFTFFFFLIYGKVVCYKIAWIEALFEPEMAVMALGWRVPKARRVLIVKGNVVALEKY